MNTFRLRIWNQSDSVATIKRGTLVSKDSKAVAAKITMSGRR